MDGSTARNPWPYVVVILALIGAAALTFALVGGEEEAAGQTVRFQAPTDPGPAPFTEPADVRGKTKVALKVGSGPFGGTGSDLVCDRELLISSLRARPERLRAWADTLGIPPTSAAVARYVRRLRTVTLVQDTRVTNHSFSGGRVVAFQSVLQAGTAVLVDQDGKPVARCRCGNPLAAPLDYPEAVCLGCPADYTPPAPCRRYTDCYRRYPHPPRVKTYRRHVNRVEPHDRLECAPPRSQSEFEECRDRNLLPKQHMGTDAVRVPDTPADNGPASATFYPQDGTPQDTYIVEGRGFAPNETVTITLTRPDGVTERYAFPADASGNGEYQFPQRSDAVLGTYVAVLTGGGESVQATTTVRAAEHEQGPEVGGGTDCNNPQSADEVELCGG
jgi:hypothetical protein